MKTKLRPSLITLALTLPLAGAMAQPGSLDTTFMPHIGPNSNVNAVVVQPDGKTVFGGAFTTVNLAPALRLARADADGNLDTSFAIGAGPDGVVNALALQVAGQLLVAGSFTNFNGTPRSGLARLTSGGSLDPSFNPGLGADGPIAYVAWLTNGQVVVQGTFTNFNGTPRLHLARLNSNGTLDASFDPGARAASLTALACQPDGKIVFSGSFTSLDGFAVTNLARLNADGSLDTNFCAVAGLNPQAVADSVSVQADGKLLLTGLFTNVNGVARNRIARLNPDGALDPDFNVGTGFNLSGMGTIRFIRSTVLSDATILAWGYFTLYNGTNRSGVARLRSNGSLDPVFNPAWGFAYSRYLSAATSDTAGNVMVGDKAPTGSNLRRYLPAGALDTDWMSEVGANNDVYTLLQRPDGKLLVGGWFTTFNLAPRRGLVRLDPDGRPDPDFTANVNTNGGVTVLALQPDGKVLVAGDFVSINGTPKTSVARLHPDGSLDSGFASGTGEGPAGYVYAMLVLTNGGVLVGGDFIFWDGIPQTGLARLDVAGQVDWNYNTNFSGEIYGLCRQPDGKILVGGNFTEIFGWPRTNLARLNADGSLDPTFVPAPGTPRWAVALALQADGKVLVGGNEGTTRQTLLRLNPDGSLDTTFTAALTTAPWGHSDPWVGAVIPQRDGRIVIGGSFYLDGNYQTVARLNPDGSWDSSFALGTTANVLRLVSQSDTQLLIGGGFNNLLGVPRGGIAGLMNNVTALPAPGVSVSYVTAWAGSNVLINGYAAGLPPMTYQWQRNGTNVPGQTNLQCSLSNLTAVNAGLYTLVASNASGAATSAPVRLTVMPASARPGTSDTSFQIGSGPNGGVWHIAEQADGKLLVAGDFALFNDQPHGGFVRLLANGSVDTNFTAAGAIGGEGSASLPLPDGRIVVGGWFTNFNGETRYNIARLETNGALDASFTTRIEGTNEYTWVWPITRQPDGKLLVGGWFDTVNGQSFNNLVRLSPDGSIDSTFTPGAGLPDYVSSLALQTDGKILVGGVFPGGIVRLNTNGTRDATFAIGTALNGSGENVLAIAVQPDGKILLGGTFPDFNSVPRTNLVRLNADGSVDTSFKPALLAWLPGSMIYGLALQTDGKIIIGAWPTGGSLPACVVRLNPDGKLDPSFQPGFCSSEGVWCMTGLASGQVMVGGGFTDFNGVPTPYLARLHSDEAIAAVLPFSLGARWNAGVFELGLFGEAGRTYTIEASTGLPAFGVWTNITSTGTNWLADPESLSSSPRFYRARLQD